jgi:pimeloyl-ACP methyl ester carboxylesterase
MRPLRGVVSLEHGIAPKLGTAVAVAALALGAGTQPAAITTELVRLATADGRGTVGLVYAPVGRGSRAGVALIHGYGSNFYSGAPGHLAPRLAERGFVAIAVNLRDHDSGPKTTLFEENRFDVQAALDELDRRGAVPVALVAHSLGTNSALHYAVETRDPRVGAIALLAGPGNAFEWNVRQFGRERATQVRDEALRRQREGHGRELMLVDLGPLGKALYSADHLVSLRGPQTRSDPYRNIAQLETPILLVYSPADALVDPEVGRRLKSAASRAPRVDLVEIPGADHAFTGHQDELARVVDGWLGHVLGR